MSKTPLPAPAAPFGGFATGKGRPTPIPAQFFSELLPQVDDLGELKLTLYILWNLGQQEGSLRFVRYADLRADAALLVTLALQPETAVGILDQSLQRALQRGTLLSAAAQIGRQQDTVYFLNSARGRAALRALQQGELLSELAQRLPVNLAPERPNIYRLYEENIGPLTPLMAETLTDAGNTYSSEWIEDAIRLAVHKNARHWRFVEAVLRSWKEKGRHGTNRQDPEKDSRQYLEGEYADFLDH
jgi:DNA replication protein